MQINIDNFEGCQECYDYVLHGKNVDLTGGIITKEEIDILKDYPNIESVWVMGLCQDTFEYFINNYGHQFKAINFWKNKLVTDLSALENLTDVEYIHYFHNQRVTKLWDMSRNKSLKALGIYDFSRLHSLENIQTAPNLEYFAFGNKVWDTAELESLEPLARCNCRHVEIYCKKLYDSSPVPLLNMRNLEFFNGNNYFTTEQIAWFVAHRPDIKGNTMCACHEMKSDDECIVWISGKRKPSLIKGKDDERIRRYCDSFNALVEKYRNMTYDEAFE